MAGGMAGRDICRARLNPTQEFQQRTGGGGVDQVVDREALKRADVLRISTTNQSRLKGKREKEGSGEERTRSCGLLQLRWVAQDGKQGRQVALSCHGYPVRNVCVGLITGEHGYFWTTNDTSSAVEVKKYQVDEGTDRVSSYVRAK